MTSISTSTLKDLGFGNWDREGEVLVFNSSDKLKSDVLNTEVEEKVVEGDSLQFEIKNLFFCWI